MAVKENSICFQHLLIFMACFGSSLATGRLCEFAEKFPGVGGSCYKGPTNDDTTKQSTNSLSGTTVSPVETTTQSTTSPPISTLSSLPDTTVSSVETTTQSTTSPPVESSSHSIDTTRLSTPTVCLRGQLRCYNDDNEMVCAAPENCTCQMTSVNASISAGGFYVNPDCTRMAHCINGNVTWDDVYSCSLNALCEEQNNVRQCYCKAGYHGDGKTCLQLTNCQDVYTAGINESGIYIIKPTNWPGSPFPVYCNMADGGGWTVFQRRVNGSVDFYRNWTSYKEGFGQIVHEFWMGNDKLYYITNQDNYQIRIDLVDREGTPYFAEYDLFRINDENDKYRLSAVGTYSGTAGTSTEEKNGLGHHFRSSFSTYDQDNDMITGHCAIIKQGAWWFNDCCVSNLNSIYSAGVVESTRRCCGGDVVSICWNNLPGPDHNIKYTEMKIRPVQV
ncbi:fibrinogen-like protein 1 [Apostichopus japonicus]|uniref:fibrinogen-like protein 1 n=1 Tax=Stichopus japonicus TaxID=307972 RepID=UPI003AB89D65